MAYAAAAAAAAASHSNNQSQSLLALATALPKAHVAGESASSAMPVTAATTTTTTANALVEGSNGEASPITTAALGGSEDQTSADGSEEPKESDPNNNNLYTLTGKGGDDNNNNISTPAATSPTPAVDEVKPREISSPQLAHSVVPRASPSPVVVYSSAPASYYPTPVSYHHSVSAHNHHPHLSSGHATQSYAMPISASSMYAHPSGALLGHNPQHMMKMMPQNFSGKPLTAVGASYPQQYAAHMAQMSKNMVQGVMPGGQQATTQQNVAQLAAAYAAQYQQHANAVAASTAQTGVVGAHQFTHRYTAPGMNGQASMLGGAQQAGVQPTPQLFPGYARAPAPPQHMFVQPPHLMRPQMPGQGNPQFYPGNLFYPGYPQVATGPAGMASPLAAATASSAGVSPSMHAANYQAIQAVQQAQSANQTGAALGLNPYKKMKTS